MKRFAHRIVFFSLFLLLAQLALAAPQPQKTTTAQIDHMLQQYADTGQFSGSVMVAQDGKVILSKGYGMANAEWGIPNRPDTKFRIASITKQFTAMLVMQQVSEGKIKLDGTISDYLPWYRKDTGSKVTVHHLLTHTSGIPSYTDRPDYLLFSRTSMGPVRQFVEKYATGDLQWEPGTKFQYNNGGFLLLGAILEQVTGKTYEQLLTERILKPLGMNNTGYDHNETVLPQRAAGYHGRFLQTQNAEFIDMSLPYAAGAMYSTVEDFVKWDQALYSDRLLSADLREKMFTPFMNDYAYGWVVRKLGEKEPGAGGIRISHEGGIQGYSTIVARYPKDKYLVVIFANLNGSPVHEMDTQITRVLYGQKPEAVKESIARVLGQTVLKENVTAAIAKYRELKQKSPDAYRWDEVQLNALGYDLMAESRLKDAIEIFKLNVEAYPTSWNVYDSLGEAYANDGQTQLAIANYRRSVELNDKNENGKVALKKLQAQSAEGK